MAAMGTASEPGATARPRLTRRGGGLFGHRLGRGDLRRAGRHRLARQDVRLQRRNGGVAHQVIHMQGWNRRLERQLRLAHLQYITIGQHHRVSQRQSIQPHAIAQWPQPPLAAFPMDRCRGRGNSGTAISAGAPPMRSGDGTWRTPSGSWIDNIRFARCTGR